MESTFLHRPAGLWVRLTQSSFATRMAEWRQRAAKKASTTLPWVFVEPWAAPLMLAVLVIAFYLPVLAAANSSIQWDAADVHYPLQRYFAERALKGLPLWTPYVYSGYPILANPEMEAWYPLNWPFYVLGFGPGSLQCELALHAFLACLGAYYFISRLGVRSSAAMLGAIAFGLSGFFAGHSSHIPVFLSAAWFPWLLWAYRRAADTPGLSNIAGGALAGGAMLLAGYYQIAFLALLGLICYAATDVWRDRRTWLRALGICAGMLAGSVALSAIQLLPAAELMGQSAAASASDSGAVLPFHALATLLYADATGIISGKAQGLITDNYLYAGLLLLPLAIVGAMKGRRRGPALVLLGFALWYALGKNDGPYFLAKLLFGRWTVGPADLSGFLAAMGLAWLAATGSEWTFRRAPVTAILLVGLVFADLWYWNSLRNPLAYARDSFASLYGRGEGAISNSLALPLLPLTRFDAPSAPRIAAPVLAPLDLKFEVTYGYFTLRPRTYGEYTGAMWRNPKLRDGLNVSRFLNPATGQLQGSFTALPRAYFPSTVADVANESASLQALAALDPNTQSIVLGAHAPLRQDRSATTFVAAFDEGSYRIHYTAATPSLLKLSVAWYPGWEVRVDGARQPLLRVDHALMGVVAPEGEHNAEFRFHSNLLSAGMITSVLTLLLLLVLSCNLHRFIWMRIRMKHV